MSTHTVDEEAEHRLTYRSAGVDIEKAASLVSRIKAIASPTHTPAVLGGIGGFGALFELPLGEYRRPVLVSGTDGVGTKLRLAIDLGVHDTVGIDLVAMCVNDILVLGARPLFFLDYYATGRLDVAVAEAVIRGIARGCEMAGAALVGGETAELPGMYAEADYDLAGFCVGIVEKDRIIDGRGAAPGQVLLGVASSGPHSNGFSLVRSVLDRSGARPGSRFGNRSLAEVLLEPTRIYTRSIDALIASVPVHAIAHITGGGLVDNVPRVLPAGTRARIDTTAWQRPPIFDWLQAEGHVDDAEMLRTFNCGIGLVVCVAESDADEAKRLLESHGEEVSFIGAVEASPEAPPDVVFTRERR